MLRKIIPTWCGLAALALSSCSKEPSPVYQYLDAGQKEAQQAEESDTAPPDATQPDTKICILEIPYNSLDEDCDGYDVTDVDGDGYDARQVSGTDCNDNDLRINPSAREICDHQDNNCNSQSDEGFEVGMPCYEGDGVCRGGGLVVCDNSGGAICTAKAREPEEELCNGIDDNCDGLTDVVISSLCADNSLDCLERKVVQTLPDRFVDYHESIHFAASAGEKFLLVWGEPRWNDEYYGRWFGFDGVPRGEEFSLDLSLVYYPENVYAYPTYYFPKLIALEDRIVLLRGLGLKVFNAQGEFMQEHRRNVSNESGFYTSAVVKDDHLLAVGYADLGRDQYDIFMERFNKDGQPVGERTLLAAESREMGVHPTIAANRQGYIVAWEAGHGNQSERIRAKIMDNQGREQVNLILAESLSPLAYTVAALPDAYAIAWQIYDRSQELNVQLFDIQGQQLCPTSILPHAGTGAEGTFIVPDASGSFLITWYREQYNQYALQRFNKNGVPVGDRVEYEQGGEVIFREYVGGQNSILRVDLEENDIVTRRINSE